MYCSNCGEQVEGKFCSFCGHKLSIETEVIEEETFEVIDECCNVEEECYDESSEEEWKPPVEFYKDFEKQYVNKEALVNIAIKHGIVDKAEDVIIAYGLFPSNVDTSNIFITSDHVTITRLNEKKPERNLIHKFERLSPELATTYDPKSMKFKNTETLLGFKISSATEMSVKRLYVTYFEILMRILPEEARRYYDRLLKPSVKSKLEVKKEEIIQTIETKPLTLEQQRKIEEVYAEKNRLKQMDKDGIPYCPKCHSQSLSANKKGFGVGKAVVGAMAVGPLGLVAGNLGAKKVRITCLNCGYEFWAGQR